MSRGLSCVNLFLVVATIAAAVFAIGIPATNVWAQASVEIGSGSVDIDLTLISARFCVSDGNCTTVKWNDIDDNIFGAILDATTDCKKASTGALASVVVAAFFGLVSVVVWICNGCRPRSTCANLSQFVSILLTAGGYAAACWLFYMKCAKQMKDSDFYTSIKLYYGIAGVAAAAGLMGIVILFHLLSWCCCSRYRNESLDELLTTDSDFHRLHNPSSNNRAAPAVRLQSAPVSSTGYTGTINASRGSAYGEGAVPAWYRDSKSAY